MQKLLRAVLLSASLLTLFAERANAHAVWVAQRLDELAVILGHGVSDESYDTGKVKDVKAMTAQGAAAKVEVEVRAKNVVLKPADDAAVVSLVFDNGFWTQKADGEWVNEGKSKYPGAKSGGHYVKHVVSVLKPLAGEAKPQGLALELVPLSDPLAKKAGDTLKVRLLLDGKPLSGAELTPDYASDPDGKGPMTDAKGEADIVVRNNGLNVIVANHTVKLTGDPEADEIGHTATLSFMIFDKEE